MNRNRIFRHTAILCLSLMPLAVSAVDSIHWDAITVSVDATRPVATTQLRVPRTDGFERLDISFRNDGSEPILIHGIDIEVPFRNALRSATPAVYGSSCMGQRPLLRETAGDNGRWSYSHMYAMVRNGEADYLFAGSLSWRVFMPLISVSEHGFRIQADGETKQIQPGETLFFEALVFGRTQDWHLTLEQFGSAIARENNVRSVRDDAFTGWATWDYYSRLFRPEDVRLNMAALEALYPQANIVQLDGGWWTARGDYMSVKPHFEGGIKALADEIRAAGKIAGLHFDGFRADITSEIYKNHPDFFLHDQDGKVIMHTRVTPDVTMRTIYFDYSHPGARAYIQECIEAMKAWGITYFKIDFMRYGLETEIKRAHRNVKSIRAYDPALSGVERFRLGMQAMREAIGTENYFLGCSAVFGPCIGFVDGMRTGGDIHPRYDAFPERVLANSGNYYLHGKVWRGDADYLVFREAADEDERVSQESHKHGGSVSLNEAQMWADYNKLYGNFRINSDNMAILRRERMVMTREVFEWPAMDVSVPVDLWDSGTNKGDGFELILARSGDAIFLGVFNWADEPKSYDLSGFGMKEPFLINGRHSQVLKYAGAEGFDAVLNAMKAKF